tara:strand:+ start:69 stop:197 length:129 start_codon:yes stop_codon:yes gene_type:complete
MTPKSLKTEKFLKKISTSSALKRQRIVLRNAAMGLGKADALI